MNPKNQRTSSFVLAGGTMSETLLSDILGLQAITVFSVSLLHGLKLIE